MSIDQMIVNYKHTVDAHRAAEVEMMGKILKKLSNTKPKAPSKKAVIADQVKTLRKKKLLKRLGNT